MITVKPDGPTAEFSFYDEKGALKTLPAGWTDAGQPDPFVALAAGRAHYRPADLLDLVRLVARLRDPDRANEQEEDVR